MLLALHLIRAQLDRTTVAQQTALRTLLLLLAHRSSTLLFFRHRTLPGILSITRTVSALRDLGPEEGDLFALRHERSQSRLLLFEFLEAERDGGGGGVGGGERWEVAGEPVGAGGAAGGADHGEGGGGGFGWDCHGVGDLVGIAMGLGWGWVVMIGVGELVVGDVRAVTG